MSDFTKTTNFTAKDALSSGDPNKVIKGSEHDTEFDNIATSSATKANKVIGATINNLVSLTSGGDLLDSAKAYPSGVIVGITDTQTLTNKTIVVVSNTVTTAAAGNLVATELNAALAELDGQDTTLASDITSHANDTSTHGVATVAGIAETQTLSNKSINSDNNTITNIVNADIKAGAAIDAAKVGTGVVSTIEFNYVNGVTSAIQTQMNLKAALASPALTGNPTAPTQTVGNDSTRLATTAFVKAENAGLNTKVIDIGDWDMDATTAADVAHGLTLGNIRSVNIIIRNDIGSTGTTLSIDNTASSGYWFVNATNISMTRIVGGEFDNSNYDSTSYNRGWITIQYTD